MTRQLLIGVAIGAGVASAVFLIATLIEARTSARSKVSQLLAVTYAKPDGPFANLAFKGVSDPAPDKEPSQYLVEIAHRCRIRAYSIEDNSNSTDVNSAARFYVRLEAVSDETFNCLTALVRQPYLHVEKTYEMCGERTESDRYYWAAVERHVPAGPLCLRRQK